MKTKTFLKFEASKQAELEQHLAALGLPFEETQWFCRVAKEAGLTSPQDVLEAAEAFYGAPVESGLVRLLDPSPTLH